MHSPPGLECAIAAISIAVQRELREVRGVSVLIYDQTCAAEKRRRRKRKLLVDPPKRAFINEWVCEGCGDCGVQSNCLSIVPLETEFGRNQIDQSACNKDFRCLDGLCPSFVTVHGGTLRRPVAAAAEAPLPQLPEPPPLAAVQGTYGILVTGVGGTGVVTIGALLGMAAHLEGKHCRVLDQTGLAQKFGAVTSHIQIAGEPGRIHAGRLALGNADLLIATDLVTAAGDDCVKRLHPGRSGAVLNTHASVVSGFTRNADLDFKTAAMTKRIVDLVGRQRAACVDATRTATGLLGDSIATNLFMVGHAYQLGWIPLSAAAIEQAIGLNGVSVEFNREAFRWGRYMAVQPQLVEQRLPAAAATRPVAGNLDEVTETRIRYLTAYQNAAYAARYRARVDAAREAERRLTPGREGLAEQAARYYFKLLAYKGEYEVARLYAETSFLTEVAARFEGPRALRFHLAPPLFAKRDPRTGRQAKREHGSWVLPLFRVLARCRALRGSAFDLFGYSAERRAERQLIADYERLLAEVLVQLSQDNHGLAVELLGLPERIRGYGSVKLQAIAAVGARQDELLARFCNPSRLRAAS